MAAIDGILPQKRHVLRAVDQPRNFSANATALIVKRRFCLDLAGKSSH
jgi:hypothetical protein